VGESFRTCCRDIADLLRARGGTGGLGRKSKMALSVIFEEMGRETAAGSMGATYNAALFAVRCLKEEAEGGLRDSAW
jgi:hypothetical protein